jgi:thymidylate synthase (FAD)
VSRRYVDDEPEFYTPDVWRGRSADKKQGSEGVVNDVKIGDITLTAKVLYNSLIDRGVCPEQARMVLPQSTMTEWYWSGTLLMPLLRCVTYAAHLTHNLRHA